jgi:hypothetical protein
MSLSTTPIESLTGTSPQVKGGYRDLFHQHHFLNLCRVLRLHADDVKSAGRPVPRPVRSRPINVITSGKLMSVEERPHPPPQHVEHRNVHVRVFRQMVPDVRLRIERIRIRLLHPGDLRQDIRLGG